MSSPEGHGAPAPAPASAAVPDPAEPTLIVSNMDVTYKVRGQDRLALRDVSFTIGRGESYGLVGESGSGKSTAALALVRYLPRNGRVSGGTIRINGRDPLAMGKAALRDLRSHTVSMVYQEPGRALNPSIRVGRQIAEVFEIDGRVLRRGHEVGRGDAAEGPDIGSRPGHGAVSARAVRWHGTAGGDRDGPGEVAVAADPGRADYRAGRDRGGRGARPGRGAAPGVPHLDPVHQPQPGGDRQDVRPGRGALRGRAGRAGPGPAGVRRSAAPVHGGAAALHPAARAAQGPRSAGHHPRLPAHAGTRHDRVHIRAAVRARAGPLPGRVAAVLRRRGPASRPLLLPRPGAGAAPGHAVVGARAGHRRDRRLDRGGREAGEDLPRRRAGAGRGRPDRAPGRDARPGRRVGQRQDHAGPGPARADRARTRARSSPWRESRSTRTRGAGRGRSCARCRSCSRTPTRR